MDKLGICNAALQELGTRTTVTAPELAAESTNEAIQFNLVYDRLRKALLRMAPWGGALRSDLLTLRASNPEGLPWSPGFPAPPWRYEYALPAGCLRACWIIPQTIHTLPHGFRSLPPRFRVQTDNVGRPSVLTDEPDAGLAYIFDQDIALMDDLFTKALTTLIAAHLCLPLKGDRSLQDTLLKQTNYWIGEARATDAQEGFAINDVTPDWMQARGSWNTPMMGPFQFFDWGSMFPIWGS